MFNKTSSRKHIAPSRKERSMSFRLLRQSSGQAPGEIFLSSLALSGSLFVAAALLSTVSWAKEACHIDPVEGELSIEEVRKAPFYDTIDECDAAKMKQYGGRGRCHCLPLGFLNKLPDQFFDRQRSEGWNGPQNFASPP